MINIVHWMQPEIQRDPTETLQSNNCSRGLAEIKT